MCIGLGGYKQPQQLTALAYVLALGMQIDVVINIDGFNDGVLPATDNVPFGVNPFFPRSWLFRVADLDPAARRLQGKIAFLEDRRVSFADGFSRWPWRLSMTGALLWRLNDRRLEARIAKARYELLESGGGEPGLQSHGPHFEYSSKDEMYDDLVATWGRCSLLMHQLASARGIEYYHFLQPNQYEGSKKLNREEMRTAYDRESRFVEPTAAVYPRLRAEGDRLRASGVRFADLSRVYSSVRDTIFVDRCCHVNSAGIAMVVDRIVREITTNPADVSPRRSEGTDDTG